MKVAGNTTIAASAAVLLAWGWNMAFPSMQMPAEVGVALGVVVGPLVAYAVGWLPMPPASEQGEKPS